MAGIERGRAWRVGDHRGLVSDKPTPEGGSATRWLTVFSRWARRIEYSQGRFRWRTKARTFTPWWLLHRGSFEESDQDCGSHDGYDEDGVTARCHHCYAGERGRSQVQREWQQARGRGQVPFPAVGQRQPPQWRCQSPVARVELHGWCP